MKMRYTRSALVGLLVRSGCALGALGATSFAPASQPPPSSTLVANARIIDGSGRPSRLGAVRIADGRIADVGLLTPLPNEAVVDARGLVLAPGFIDNHSHADFRTQRNAVAATTQGVTTVVVGVDGHSPVDLAAAFADIERVPPSINVASYIGHGAIRSGVMKDDFRREATAAEVEAMRVLVDKGMQAGALGLSTGLEYDPGIYSARSEVVELAKVAARHGGRYHSHMRSEDRDFWAALDELLTIGREAKLPVQVSHVKLAMVSLWGKADELLATLDKARASGIDVTLDVYPYPYWQSTLTVMFPKRDFANRASAEFAVREVARPEGQLIPIFAPQPRYAGMTLAQIAAERKQDAADTLMALIAEAEAYRKKHPEVEEVESVIGTSMDERDIRRLMQWPHAAISSDGELDGPHPRGRGSYPRVLGRYVREDKVLSLEEAVRRMTSNAAANVGIRDRGTIEPGKAADLVLFDPDTIIDHATPADPKALSTGVQTVWVNGVVVLEQGKPTDRYPGRIIRRAR